MQPALFFETDAFPGPAVGPPNPKIVRKMRGRFYVFIFPTDRPIIGVGPIVLGSDLDEANDPDPYPGPVQGQPSPARGIWTMKCSMMSRAQAAPTLLSDLNLAPKPSLSHT